MRPIFQRLYGERQLITTLYVNPVSDCHHRDASDRVPLPDPRTEQPEGGGADLGRQRQEWVPCHGQVPARLHPGTTVWILRSRRLRILQGRPQIHELS